MNKLFFMFSLSILSLQCLASGEAGALQLLKAVSAGVIAAGNDALVAPPHPSDVSTDKTLGHISSDRNGFEIANSTLSICPVYCGIITATQMNCNPLTFQFSVCCPTQYPKCPSSSGDYRFLGCNNWQWICRN